MQANNLLDFCLLIPCYNNLDGLLRSLQSVKYPADKFLIVIVDDGSDIAVDKTQLDTILANSLPLAVIRLDKNHGITRALNEGLQWIQSNAQCKYLARLDCADTCNAERFRLQVDLLNKNSNLGLIGTWCKFREPATGKEYEYRTPVKHEDIERDMYFKNVFIHPTVMFRSSYIKEIGIYPTSFEYAEDYAYFWQMMNRMRTLVIDKFLVTCEVNRAGISYTNKSKQIIARQRVIKKFGKNRVLRIIGTMRLGILLIIPKRLLLLLKQFRG